MKKDIQLILISQGFVGHLGCIQEHLLNIALFHFNSLPFFSPFPKIKQERQLGTILKECMSQLVKLVSNPLNSLLIMQPWVSYLTALRLIFLYAKYGNNTYLTRYYEN